MREQLQVLAQGPAAAWEPLPAPGWRTFPQTKSHPLPSTEPPGLAGSGPSSSHRGSCWLSPQQSWDSGGPSCPLSCLCSPLGLVPSPCAALPTIPETLLAHSWLGGSLFSGSADSRPGVQAEPFREPPLPSLCTVRATLVPLQPVTPLSGTRNTCGMKVLLWEPRAVSEGKETSAASG